MDRNPNNKINSINNFYHQISLNNDYINILDNNSLTYYQIEDEIFDSNLIKPKRLIKKENNRNNKTRNQETSLNKTCKSQKLKKPQEQLMNPTNNNSNRKSLSFTNISSNGKKTKGRVKIKMEFIENKIRRYTTFSKRKTGIMKKAYELSTLTGTQVMLLVASETGHVYTFATEKLKPIITSDAGKNLIQSCLNDSNEENFETLNISSNSTLNNNNNNKISIEDFDGVYMDNYVDDEDEEDDDDEELIDNDEYFNYASKGLNELENAKINQENVNYIKVNNNSNNNNNKNNNNDDDNQAHNLVESLNRFYNNIYSNKNQNITGNNRSENNQFQNLNYPIISIQSLATNGCNNEISEIIQSDKVQNFSKKSQKQLKAKRNPKKDNENTGIENNDESNKIKKIKKAKTETKKNKKSSKKIDELLKATYQINNSSRPNLSISNYTKIDLASKFHENNNDINFGDHLNSQNLLPNTDTPSLTSLSNFDNNLMNNNSINLYHQNIIENNNYHQQNNNYQFSLPLQANNVNNNRISVTPSTNLDVHQLNNINF